MTLPGIPGQDAASIAVLQNQQQNIERQLTEMQRSTGEQLSAISAKLDKLADMGLEVGRIGQSLAHTSETVTRAHARLDSVERDLADHMSESTVWRESAQARLDARMAPTVAKLDAVANTQTRWTGIYIGVQAVLTLLVALMLWVANGYVTRVDAMEKQLQRAERTLDNLAENEGKR